MKAIRKQGGMAAAVFVAAMVCVGCGGNGADANLAAERQRLAVAASTQAEQMRLASVRVQALDVELRGLEETLSQLERTHAAQVNQMRLQSQKLAAELAALKLSMGVATPAVVAAPEVAIEPGTAPVVVLDQGGAVPARATAGPVEKRPYGFMAKLFFLVVLVLAVGLIFHVVMSRVQEEEDDEGEDRQYRTEEGTISLSPRAQREMGEGGGEGGERKDPYT